LEKRHIISDRGIRHVYWTTVVTYVQHVVSRHSLIVGAWHAQRGVTVLSCEQTDLSKVSVTSAYHRISPQYMQPQRQLNIYRAMLCVASRGKYFSCTGECTNGRPVGYNCATHSVRGAC